MKNNVIIGINLGDYGSTGIIMRNSLEYANKHGDFDYLIITPKSMGKPNTYAFFEQNTIVDKIDRRMIHKSIDNPDGLFEYRATKRIINKINEQCRYYKNVIIHLHNIHMAHIDFRVLFSYLSKKKKINHIFYTIHDEWPYSGACYVHMNNGKFNCNKWKTGCRGECPQKYGTKKYPVFKLWELKKKYTLLLKEKMTLLPVSNWVNDELSQSFLKEFKRYVINGETNITNLGYRDLKLVKKYSLNNKRIVLTVSSYWNEWKGVGYIYEIAEKLPENYVVLIIGGKFDKRNHKNIIHVRDVPYDTLNHYYSIADVYMSTSQTESLGLTTCESQICGIPIVAFGHAAIKETFVDGKTGILVGENNDIEKMVDEIVKIIETNPFKQEDIINNGNKYAKYTCAKKYYGLYLKCLG